MSSLSIGKAWDEASAFLKRESRLVTPVALAMFMVPATLYGWYNPSGDPNQASAGLGWPITLILLAMTIMGQMVIAGMAIGWAGSVGAGLRHAFKRVWGVLGALMLVFIPLTILLLLAIAVLLGGAGITDPADVTPQSIAMIPGITPLLLVMVALFLYVGTKLFPIAAVGMVETANPLRLLGRSWKLTGGAFWRLLGTFLLILVVNLVASLAVLAVIGSIMTVAAGEAQPYNLTALIVALFDGLVGALIAAISAALVGRVYAQLAAPIRSVPEVEREG
ncbi:MAG: hypothetical protein M3Q19_07355 [Pseudomonadota bacterium]|nr:hypothetical protein [Pseudomonadota bacterium]